MAQTNPTRPDRRRRRVLQADRFGAVGRWARTTVVQISARACGTMPVQREPVLANGWFAATQSRSVPQFSDHYRMASMPPPRIATLSYDAIRWSPAGTRAAVRAVHRSRLTDPTDFRVSTALPLPRRRLATGVWRSEVSATGFTVVDTRPRAFRQRVQVSELSFQPLAR